MSQPTRLFQIAETDLATLESDLPKILESTATSCNAPDVWLRWNRVKKILAEVRWNYGPPVQVKEISASEPPFTDCDPDPRQ